MSYLAKQAHFCTLMAKLDIVYTCQNCNDALSSNVKNGKRQDNNSLFCCVFTQHCISLHRQYKKVI